MHYQQLIESNIQAQHCPFCDLDPATVIDETEHCAVLLARAPYIKNHLLLVPKRHLIRYRDLTAPELLEFDLLIHRRMEKLQAKHQGVNLLLRDGTVHSEIGKSVDHLHFHLVPDLIIGGQEIEKMRNRKFYEQEEFENLIGDFKKNFC